MSRINRVVEVVVGDTRMRNLFTRFQISRGANGVPASGKIDVFNLAEETEERIYQRAQSLEIFAGHESDDEVPPLLAKGDVRRVSRGREGNDRVTSIGFGGSVDALTRAYISHTWKGTIKVRDIIRDAVEGIEGGALKGIEGVSLGPSKTEIPSRLTEKDFMWSGAAPAMFRELLSQRGIEWYEQDAVIEFNAPKTAGIGAVLKIGPNTGMIGTPTVTDEGVELSTLLDPRIRLDSRFQVEGLRVLGIETQPEWTVTSVEHRGDNRTGEFQTTLKGVDPERQEEVEDDGA